MRKWIDWLRIPLHDFVLPEKLDILGGAIRTQGSQAIELLGSRLAGDTCVGQNKVDKEAAEPFLQLLVALKAGPLLHKDSIRERVHLIRQQPYVVAAGLRDFVRRTRHVFVLLILDIVSILGNALLCNDPSGLLRPTADMQNDGDSFKQ